MYVHICLKFPGKGSEMTTKQRLVGLDGHKDFSQFVAVFEYYKYINV